MTHLPLLGRSRRRRSSIEDAKKRSRGQSLVEFAIVFPIFILVLFAVIEFSFMLYSQMTVSNAAREGEQTQLLA